jgi:hypothetical protein
MWELKNIKLKNHKSPVNSEEIFKNKNRFNKIYILLPKKKTLSRNKFPKTYLSFKKKIFFNFKKNYFKKNKKIN